MKRNSTKSGFLAFIAIVVLLCAGGVFELAAQAMAPSLDAEQLAAIAKEAEAAALAALKATGASSVSIAFGDASGPLWSAQFGFADRDAGRAPDETTMFGIGSTSKMFATAAAMILAERGFLELDSPLVRYLPEFRMASPGYEKITVRMLLNHSAGFPGTDYRNVIVRGPVSGYFRQAEDTLARSRLKHEPGHMSVYANDGFTLIEALVERLTGLSYPRFIQKEIFDPLRMRHSTFPLSAFPADSYAITYSQGKVQAQEYLGALASGGIYSTASDLARFAAMFLNKGQSAAGQILNPASIEAMAVDQMEGTFDPVKSGSFRYGLGWDSIAQEGMAVLGIPAWIKGGDTNSYGAALIVLPAEGLSAAVLGASGLHSDTAAALSEIILARALLEKGRISAMPEALPPPSAKEADVLPQLRAALPGIYASFASIGNVVMSPEGRLTMRGYRNGKWIDSIADLVYHEDGWFTLPGEAAGMVGLRWIEAEGREYLAIRTPGINGWYRNEIVFAQKLEPAPALSPAWKARTGKTWLPVNYSETDDYLAPGTDPRLVVRSVDEAEGYLFTTTSDGTMTTRPPAEGGGFESHSVILIPRLYGRDLYDVVVEPRGGEEWIRLGSTLYRPVDSMQQATAGENSVTIAPDATLEWLSLPPGAKFDPASVKGARAVRLYDKNCAQQDATIPAVLPDGGYLALFGNPGDAITVSLPATADLEKAVEFARKALAADLASETAGSAAIAIIDKGKIVFSEGFGLADRERNIPAGPDTIFNIGSISKSFCASAVMALVDEGRLDLDENVVRYLPEFTMADPRHADITVRMLLNHSSGLPGTNWENGMGFKPDASYNRTTLEKLSRQFLKHAPGEYATYCNDGFTLAELVVERVSGMSFMDYVAQRVLAPLGLSLTGLSIGQRPEEPAALYYEPGTGKREPRETINILGAGGMSSTAEDLARYAFSFSGKGPQFLKQAPLLEMLQEQPSAGKKANPLVGWPYGLGWDLVEKQPFSDAGIQVLAKGGNTGRYTSQIIVAPAQGIAVAVVESAAAAPAFVTATGVLQHILAGKGLMSTDAPAAAAAPGDFQPIPAAYAEFDGWYGAGGYVIKVQTDLARNVLNTLILYQGHEMARPPARYRDGAFYAEGSNPIRMEKVNGIACLVVESPFGREVAAQRMERVESPKTLNMDIAGKLWLRRNIGPAEGRSMALFNPFVVSNLIPGFPGYVDFDGIKEVMSPTRAKIATGYVRDQMELELFEKDGKPWALLSWKLMSPADAAPRLRAGTTTLRIGSEGFSEWLVAEEALTVLATLPASGRIVVYSPALNPVYDSILDKGEFKVEKGGLIRFAGMPGDNFALTARSGFDASVAFVRETIARDLAAGVGGTSVAIMDQGRIVYSEGFGMADRAAAIPADSSTLYNIGSISKVFCSAALMLLVDDGLLKLDDKVVEHLPEFRMEDPRYRDITLRMLLNHSSGLPGSTLANSFGSELNREFRDQLLSTLRRSRLRADPGKFASYCNDGFSLAELVIVRVSGMPYEEFLRTRLLDPLRLDRTGLSVGLRSGEQAALYYRHADGAREALEVVSAIGAGGLASTAEDLCRFADSFSRSGALILSEASLREMTKPQPSLAALAGERNPEMPFGLGWDVALPSFFADQGIQVFWKGGDTFNHHALLLTSPDHRLSLAILQSGEGSGLIALAKGLFESLLKEKGIAAARPLPAPAKTESTPVPAEFRDFAGWYGPSLFRLALSPEGDSFTQYMALGGVEFPVMTMHHVDGHFEDGHGMNYFLTRLEGRQYLAGSVFDDCIRMLIGQKLTAPAGMSTLRSEVDGKIWLKRSVKPFVTPSDSVTHILVSRLPAALPGYVDFSGIKEIAAPDRAGMPIEAISEQNELLLIEKDGKDWAVLADAIYSPADVAISLARGTNTLAIAPEGLNEWRTVDADQLLRISLPPGGRLIAFSTGHAVLHDSAFASSSGGAAFSIELRVPAGSYIECAGNPQDVFNIVAE